MANTLEYAIKIRDLTKQGLNSAKSGIESFGKQLGSSTLARMGKGILLAGIIAQLRELARTARETGDYSLISKEQVQNIEAAGDAVNRLSQSIALIATGKLGQTISGGLTMLVNSISEKLSGASWGDALSKGMEKAFSVTPQMVAQANAELEKQRQISEQIAAERRKQMSNEELLADVIARQSGAAKAQSAAGTDTARLEAALNLARISSERADIEKKITSEKEKQQRLDEEASQKANDAARQVDRAGGMLARGEDLKGLALSTNARKAAERQGLNIERRDRKFDKLLANARDKMTDPVKLARGQKLTKSEILALQAEKLLVAGANDPGKVQEQQLRELQNLNTHVLHLMTQR